MINRYLIVLFFSILAGTARSQSAQDTIPPVMEDDFSMDSLDVDAFLSDFDLFLDSILAPRSYFLANVSVASGHFNFISQNRLQVRRKNIWSPALGYYHKSGLGISATGNIVDDEKNLNLFQYSISPSYDYIQDRRMAAGISYSRFFTKDKLPFYVSPLQNEVYGYFLWRKSWLQPGITANYGWGSRTEFRRRELIYRKLVAHTATTRRLRDLIVTDTALIITRNRSSIVDFTVSGSVRHDFYWLNIFSDKDYIRFTPLLSAMAGTQKFGYNQTAVTSGGGPRINLLSNTGARNISLEDKFQLLSLSLYLRAEYNLGKFFFQPQFVLDYYLPAKEDHLGSFFSVNMGMTF